MTTPLLKLDNVGKDYAKVEALQMIKKSIDANLERFGRRYFELLPKPKENSANNKLAALRAV